MKKIKYLCLFVILISFILFFYPCCRISETEDGYLGMSLPADFLPFSGDQYWCVPISENPVVDPNSATMIETIGLVLINMGKSNLLNVVYNYKEWTVPLHVVDSSVATKRKVYLLSYDSENIEEDIPIPDSCWADPEGDGHMLIIDIDLMKSWDFFHASKRDDDDWSADGYATWDLEGNGYIDGIAGNAARGSGMPLAAGLIRLEEIEAGEINHALACGIPSGRKYISDNNPDNCVQFCRPASRSDGRFNGTQFIPQGARIQLNPSIDLDNLDLSGPAKTIARAMQVYGLYNCDNAGSFCIYLQNLGSEGGDWVKYEDELNDLHDISIENFRVLGSEIETYCPE